MTFNPNIQCGTQSWSLDVENANQTLSRSDCVYYFSQHAEEYLARPARDLPVQVLLELGHKLHASNFSCPNWAILAERLGYGRNKIEEFEVQGSVKGEPSGFRMLLDWTQQEQGRSLFVLMDSLLSCGRHDCARFLDDKIEEMVHMVLYLHVVDETDASSAQRFLKVATRCDATLKDSLQNFLGSDDSDECEYELVDAPLMARAREFKGKHITLKKHLRGHYSSTASMSSSSDELAQLTSGSTSPEQQCSSLESIITPAPSPCVQAPVYANPEILFESNQNTQVSDCNILIRDPGRLQPTLSGGDNSTQRQMFPISPNDNVFYLPHGEQSLSSEYLIQNQSDSEFIQTTDNQWHAAPVWNTYPRVLVKMVPQYFNHLPVNVYSGREVDISTDLIPEQNQLSGTCHQVTQSPTPNVTSLAKPVKSKTVSKVVYITEDCVYCGKTRTIENREGLMERTNLGIHCPSCNCGNQGQDPRSGVMFRPVVEQAATSNTGQDNKKNTIYSDPWDTQRLKDLEQAYIYSSGKLEGVDKSKPRGDTVMSDSHAWGSCDNLSVRHSHDTEEAKDTSESHTRGRSLSDPAVSCIADLQGKFDYSDSCRTVNVQVKDYVVSHETSPLRPHPPVLPSTKRQASQVHSHRVVKQSISKISEVLRNFPGWCPLQTENTVEKSMRVYCREDGHYIIWFMRSKQQLVLSVTHLQKLIHYAVYQETISNESTYNYYIFSHQKFQNLRSLLRFHQQHGLDPQSKQQQGNDSFIDQQNLRDSRRVARYLHVRLRYPYIPLNPAKMRTSV